MLKMIELKNYMRLLQLIIFFVILSSGCSDSVTMSQYSHLFVGPAIAYQPRGFMLGTESQGISKEQITDDLRLLRKSGFRSLVTYGAKGVQRVVPEIARSEGFDGMVVMGIWDIFSKEEWNNALGQAAFVDGYCLGNEGLGIRYSPDELESKMNELRWLTGKLVTTSEPMSNYFAGPYRDWLLSNSDWLFPNFIPTWDPELNPDRLVKWTVGYHDYLVAISEKTVILKEAGFPSAASEYCNEEMQLSFFKTMESSGVPFFYFEAFDQPWKRDILNHREIEAHWGLYSADGTPKKIIHWLVSNNH